MDDETSRMPAGTMPVRRGVSRRRSVVITVSLSAGPAPVPPAEVVGETFGTIGFRRDRHGVGRPHHSDRGVARGRPAAAPRQPRANGEARAGGVGGVGGVRSRLRGRRAGLDGRPGLLRVPERLRDREVAQHRQRVRVGGDLLQLRHPGSLPAPGAVLGHLRRAGDARHLHLRRHRPHRGVLVDAPRVRCGAAVLRVQGPAAQGGRGSARSRPRGEAARPLPARAVRARRPALRREGAPRPGQVASVWSPRRCSPRWSWSR